MKPEEIAATFEPEVFDQRDVPELGTRFLETLVASQALPMHGERVGSNRRASRA